MATEQHLVISGEQTEQREKSTDHVTSDVLCHGGVTITGSFRIHYLSCGHERLPEANIIPDYVVIDIV